MRVLLIEDTDEIGEAIVSRMSKLGYAVDWELTGAGAEVALRDVRYDLVILDLILPDRDGLLVLKFMRDRGLSTPVLVLTARSAVTDRIDGLDLGADDYMVKPFDYRELEARVRALVRRGDVGLPSNTLTVGNLVIDRSSRSARVGTTPLELTPREYALLEVLMGRQVRVFTKAELMGQLFGAKEDAASENALEQVVARLRRKLVSARSTIGVRTYRGLGYQLVTT